MAKFSAPKSRCALVHYWHYFVPPCTWCCASDAANLKQTPCTPVRNEEPCPHTLARLSPWLRALLSQASIINQNRQYHLHKANTTKFHVLPARACSTNSSGDAIICVTDQKRVERKEEGREDRHLLLESTDGGLLRDLQHRKCRGRGCMRT
jgi:hypothetical protein